MAVYPWQATVQDQDGNGVGSAQVTVRIDGSGGDLATIYSDAAETSKTNPFNATVDGFAQFWAKAGTYYIEGVSSAQTTDGWYVVLGGSDNQVTLTATVAAGEAVTADGALATEATAAEYLGLAQVAGVATDTISVQSVGNFTLGTWAWTPDEYVYLTSAGALTQTPPTGTHRRIGIATTATTIALNAGPVVTEVGGAGAENAIPALSDAGLVDYTMIEKAATGGAGAEDLLVQADGSGEIDISFLGAVVDTSKQLTASGAITAGDAVAIVAAGEVEPIGVTAGTISSATATASAEFGDAAKDCAQAFSTTDNVTVLVYTDTGNSNYLTAVAVSLSAGVRTYGTPAVLVSASSSLCTVDYDPVNDVFISAYYDDAGTTIDAIAFTVNGTTIDAIGTPVEVRAAVASLYSPCIRIASTGSHYLITYVRNGTAVYAKAGTVSGTVLTLGTESTVDTGDIEGAGIVYSSIADKYVVIYGDNTANQIESKVASVSGTTISLGAQSTVQSSVSNPGSAFYNGQENPNDGQLLVCYADAASSVAVATGTISGTTATWTDTESFATENPLDGQIGFNPVDENWAMVGQALSVGGYLWVISVSGGVITVDSATSLGTPNRLINAQNNPHMPWDSNDLKYVSSYYQTTNTTYVAFVDPGVTQTNARRFVGFAQESVADTETVEVAMLGDINADQTGLTFNTDYYISALGALSAVDTGYGKVGRAVSATEILVTKNTWV